MRLAKKTAEWAKTNGVGSSIQFLGVVRYSKQLSDTGAYFRFKFYINIDKSKISKVVKGLYLYFFSVKIDRPKRNIPSVPAHQC